MSWYNEAIFYHIYPLGLTGAPKQNEYTEPVHRLNTLLPWIGHIKESDAQPCISDRSSKVSAMAMRQQITRTGLRLEQQDLTAFEKPVMTKIK